MNELLSRVGVIDLKEDIDQPTQVKSIHFILFTIIAYIILFLPVLILCLFQLGSSADLDLLINFCFSLTS